MRMRTTDTEEQRIKQWIPGAPPVVEKDRMNSNIRIHMQQDSVMLFHLDMIIFPRDRRIAIARDIAKASRLGIKMLGVVIRAFTRPESVATSHPDRLREVQRLEQLCY